jgi:glucose-6-phosphate isomerase
MQLPDEIISYQYQSLLVPASAEWNPSAELKAAHFLPPARLKELIPRVLQVRSQVAAERDLEKPQAEGQGLEPGFIDLPQKALDDFRRHDTQSVLGHVFRLATFLREQVDRVIVLGSGGACLGSEALFRALRSTYHNELPPEARPGLPRVYFESNNADNDALRDLLELLETTCVDPELREERWGVVVVSKSGGTLETAAALRVFQRDAREYYSSRSDRLKKLFLAVTGPDGKLRARCKADGVADEDVLTIPQNVGDLYSVFTPGGLLPAAVLGLDLRALLLGASAMTKLFLEEPFERNPVLQYAAVNYLMAEEVRKPVRVLSVWSRKLEALGRWYEHLLAGSLSKQGRGPIPSTALQTRDLHSTAQQSLEGRRDRMINNLIVKTPTSTPIEVGVSDRNEDGLNSLGRKTLPNLADAARAAAAQAYSDNIRPSADILVPTISEHTMGQLLQMLMLATAVEGRMMGVNPYGQPGVEAFRRRVQEGLKT